MKQGTTMQINQVLSSFALQNEKGNLAGLRQILQQNNFGSEDEKSAARELVALAHLACFNFDARPLAFAIEYFAEKKDWSALSELLRLNKMYGNIRQVWQIKQIGEEYNIPELQVPDFKDWFFNFGLKWFDLYKDDNLAMAYMNDADQLMINQIIRQYFAAEEFWPRFLKQAKTDPNISSERLEILIKLSRYQEPFVYLKNKAVDVEKEFFAYCENNNLLVISRLQSGIDNVRSCSYVYLVLDQDGIFKVFKQILNYNNDRVGQIFNTEDQIYEQLGLAKPVYQKVQIAPRLEFLKFPFKYGQPLSDYIRPDNLLSFKQVIYLVGKIAQQLVWLKQKNILHLDLKPEDILFDSRKVEILDYGVSRILTAGQKEVDIYLANPRYGTPECGLQLKASYSSEVFQLGIIFHQLLTGTHPFAIEEMAAKAGDSDREREILNYFWPNIVRPYNFDLAQQFGDDRLAILPKMLAKEPQDRPSIEEVCAALQIKEPIAPIKLKGRQSIRAKEANIVLFPARMGIPHKGHIEYISRLLQLGFYVVISLQRSYTISKRDPLPKWLVAKMIAQSLFDQGFISKDFHFVFTPYYETQAELALHFTMMPEWENVIAVASSNPEIPKIFKQHAIFDQKMVFGTEGKKYDDLSWGEILRQSVVSNDYQTFCLYQASGVEAILTLGEIQAIYGKPEIEFVSGQVKVVLVDHNDQEIVAGRVFKYLSPEQSLIRHLYMIDAHSKIVDLYAKDTLITLAGETKSMKYLKTVFESGNETIYFQLR